MSDASELLGLLICEKRGLTARRIYNDERRACLVKPGKSKVTYRVDRDVHSGRFSHLRFRLGKQRGSGRMEPWRGGQMPLRGPEPGPDPPTGPRSLPSKDCHDS